MSEFFKSKGKLGLTLCALLLVVVLTAGSVALMLSDGGVKLGSAEGSEQQGQGNDGGGDDDGGNGIRLNLGGLLEASGMLEQQESAAPAPVQYNVPSEMRGVFLVPGQDFLTGSNPSESELKAQVDKAVTDAGNFTMNTIIVDTVYGDQVIFPTAGANSLSTGFDLFAYIVDRAREEGLHVYAIFDASLFTGSGSGGMMLSLDGGAISTLTGSLADFATAYQLDGILIDGYADPDGESEESSYGMYLRTGGAIGYQNYLRQAPSAVVKTASNTVRNVSPGTQVGLLAHAVWANQDENEEGSATAATFTSLGTANADTKGFVENGYVDFVAVRAFGSLTDAAEPFEEVVSWWAGVARQNGVPMYVVHASDRICTDNSGWTGADQITKQVIQTDSMSGVRGNIFNSLARMVDNPNDATTTLVKYFNEEVEAAHILTELQMTKPETLTFTTQEPSVTFTGASDPNSPVTINGEEVTTDANGYFTTSIDLSAGENVFVIEHKEKTITYTITRNIDIVKEVTPTGSLATDGNMNITITALAYEDATVTASVGGVTVPMSIDQSYESEEARDSNYRMFVGTFTAPAATSSEQSLGAIQVTASWQGQSKTLTGASITVNKRAQMEDGVPVVVIAEQATTYPPDTLNNIPSASYYPLPKGAMDYLVGDELTYVKGSTTYTYYQLASGLRVESGDIQAISSDYAAGNAISGMTVHTENGYTYLTIKTAQQVSYLFDYSASQIKITFNYTTSTPGGSTVLNSNPLFTQASWGSDTLTLSLMKSGGFMGYKGYYDSAGNLVFRFNNPPSSISGARIAIDPGHGGNDPGALGFLKDYPERVINLAIARQLADELQARGATVLLLDTSGNPSLQNRVAQAENFGADVFVSVHNNTAPNAGATGTEVYYFYPFSRTLAANASSAVSSSFGTNNRGAKWSYFNVTLSSQFASVLVECGFMSNQGEYEKLIKSANQQRIAEGIADGIAATINATYTGSGASGSQTVGSGPAATSDTQENGAGSSNGGDGAENGDNAGNTDNNNQDNSGNDDQRNGDNNDNSNGSATNGNGGTAPANGSETVGDFQFTNEYYNLTVGSDYTLPIQTDVNSPNRSSLSWKSSDTRVATVSSSGVVTPLKEGTATITATTKDGNVSKSCDVDVSPRGSVASGASATVGGSGSSGGAVALRNANGVRLEKTDITLYRSTKTTLAVLCDGGTVQATDFQWESSDTNIATVDSKGVVTAKSRAGTTTITASASGYQLSCEVRVSTSQVSVRGVSLNKSSISLVRGNSETLVATVNPSGATNQNVTWKSSDTNKATVDSNGRVTAKNSGTVTITVTTKDGGYTDTCTVYVTARGVDVEEVSIWPYNLSEMAVGDVEYLEADVYPDEATNTAVTWKSSNSSILKVDDNGKITAVGRGTATITATSKSNTNRSDSITIRVY